LNRFVRAFKGFDREDGSVFYDDRLADIERAQLFRDVEAESNVFLFALF